VGGARSPHGPPGTAGGYARRACGGPARAAALLGAPERQLVVAVVELVDPGDAGLQLAGGPVDGDGVAGPDRGAEPVGGGVGPLDRLVQVLDPPHRQHRAEHLLGGQAGVGRDVDHHRRLEEVARPLDRLAADDHLGPPVDRVGELGGEQCSLLGGVQRADPQPRLLGLGRAGAGLVAPDPAGQLLHEGVVDRRLHEGPLGGQAGLAAVPVAADLDVLDGGVQVGVGQDDGRVGAAQLQADVLEGGAGDLHDPPPGGRLAGEGEAAGPRVGDQSLPGRGAAGDHVQHPGGQAGLGGQPGHGQGGQRGRLSRLGDHGVAGGQGRAELVAEQGQGEVPGGDGAHHPERPAHHQPVGGAELAGQLLVGAADLGGRLGVEAQPAEEVAQLALGLQGRLALLAGEQGDQVAGGGLGRVGQGAQVAGPLGGVDPPPGRERLGGRGHGRVDLGRGGLGDLVDGLARGGVGHDQAAARPGHGRSAYPQIGHGARPPAGQMRACRRISPGGIVPSD
jgi:hypothetical protein